MSPQKITRAAALFDQSEIESNTNATIITGTPTYEHLSAKKTQKSPIGAFMAANCKKT